MHLLLAQKGSINEGEEAIDLGQSPGDIVFLSAADTEIASLAAAFKIRQQANADLTLRLANLMRLSHPMSVDAYCEKTIVGSRLMIVRALGGESYWGYALERLYSQARENNVALIALPGDDKPDIGLERFCTVERRYYEKVQDYLVQGGPNNMARLLEYCTFLLDDGPEPPDAQPLLKAGLWHPEKGVCGLDEAREDWFDDAPVVAISFYRALVQSGQLQPIEAMMDALRNRRLNALSLFVSSLKEPTGIEVLRKIFSQTSPDIALNATGFAVSSPGKEYPGGVLDETGAVVLQMIMASGSRENWQNSSRGLSSRDLAMNVALPEVDGRVLTRAIAFKSTVAFDESVQTNIVSHEADAGRVNFVADLAMNWTRLRRKPAGERKIALILANYPNRDGRLGNGVGLDTPAGTVNILNKLREAGYKLEGYPDCGDDLILFLQEGPTNAATDGRKIRETISLDHYTDFFKSLPAQVQNQTNDRWGKPENDPFYLERLNAIALPIAVFGHVAVGIQPARGYNINPKESYHSPDLQPPHGYLAFYAWLRNQFGSNAIVHMGKHGNLEWLPGKALSLSETCYPEAALGPVPHLYPFIVNDPGEGSQAKRRSSAVIIDHLTPPLTRAESYGPLRDLEALVDEYYEASGNDPRRLALLKKQILDLISDIGLDKDAGIEKNDRDNERLEKLDAYLCELKEMQIRDGLHIFGISPEGRLRDDLAVAMTRTPRGLGDGENQSLQRAISTDLELNFDPLDCDMAQKWTGPRPDILADVSDEIWRSVGDSVERIEALAVKFVSNECEVPDSHTRTKSVMNYIYNQVLPDIDHCGDAEIAGLLTGLDGYFVPPGPSGAPTRGRNDVLPTGRNFYSVDSRSIPTPTAWELGRKSAELLIARFRQDNGDWPKSFGLSAWGTANMRTGGDDIAQALALIGARPVWDHASRRVTGYEIITLTELGRPRVDLTLRISGFFRDAFPVQIELFDKAIREIGKLEEEDKDNPIAARMKREYKKLLGKGVNDEDARRRSGFSIFGSRPGAYGAGLQALMDEKGWDKRDDLAEAYLAWGSYAYGEKEEGLQEREIFSGRLKEMEAVIHNQDNREHDILDSDDYYQFEGGMAVAIEHFSGKRPKIYHNDHSRPEKPIIRALEEEIARVTRARAANPKWIAGVMRHGYKGAFEMAATVDYLFAFAATTGAVRDHHFDLVYDAYLGNDETLEFLMRSNPEALREMAQRFLEAEERELWKPRSNSARFQLEKLAK